MKCIGMNWNEMGIDDGFPFLPSPTSAIGKASLVETLRAVRDYIGRG